MRRRPRSTGAAAVVRGGFMDGLPRVAASRARAPSERERADEQPNNGPEPAPAGALDSASGPCHAACMLRTLAPVSLLAVTLACAGCVRGGYRVRTAARPGSASAAAAPRAPTP